MFSISYDLLLTLVGISTTLHVFNHRYDCMHQLCVWYAGCKRKYRQKKTQNIERWVLSYIRDVSVGDNRESTCHSNDNMHITLFPHIKHISTTDANNNEVVPSEALLKGIRRWTLVCDPHNKELLSREVCLYRNLKTHCTDKTSVPHSITITLDKALIDLLNIQVPVHTNDGTYILNDDTVQQLSF